MADTTFEMPIDDLHKRQYTLRYWGESGDVRLVEYKELSRESTRKRIWNVDRWYNWHNNRDRHQSTFIPISEITLPQIIKDRFIQELITGLRFITKE